MLADYFTSYESATGCLTFALILLIPLAISFAYERWLKPAAQSPKRMLIPEAHLKTTSPLPSFYIGQIVQTTHELNFSHGGGLMVPAGEEIELVSCHCTNHGFRWAGLWRSGAKPQGVYVYPIPEDMIARQTVHS